MRLIHRVKTLALCALAVAMGCTPASAPKASPQPALETVVEPAKSLPYPAIERLGLSEAKAAFDAGKNLFVDVRTLHEYEEAHIPGALWMPVDDIAARQGELPRDTELLLYCT